MATTGTVLRFRALYAAAVPCLLTLSILLQLAAPSVATPAKASTPDTDSSAAAAAASYRSYHFVLLVKSNGSNRTDHHGNNVSEELVIMPTDADLLEQADGGAIELKPQPLPSRITSAFVNQYHSKRASTRKRSQASIPPAPELTESGNAATGSGTIVEPSIHLHTVSRGTAKKQRFPKKVPVVTTVKTQRQPADKAIRRLDSTKLEASLRQLSLPDTDLAPYELVATSKGLHGQPRTVRRTVQPPSVGELQPPRYEVIGTFRDAHVSRTRARRQSDSGQEDESVETAEAR